MMIEKDLKDRTKKFAHDCVKFSLTLPESVLGKHVRGQLIRSATSVAANYSSACVAQSKNAFIAKLSISIEECDESHFWIEFLLDEQIGEAEFGRKLLKESRELYLILMSSRKTAQERINQKSTIENKK
jgi:four helix bundle protein